MELMHGDCLELMKQIPDGSVDMVLCDLPYGTIRCEWDRKIPFAPLWEQYKRVIKSNAFSCSGLSPSLLTLYAATEIGSDMK